MYIALYTIKIQFREIRFSKQQNVNIICYDNDNNNNNGNTQHRTDGYMFEVRSIQIICVSLVYM